jgi:hypothetical protein
MGVRIQRIGLVMTRRPRPHDETKLGEFMEWWSDAPAWFKGVLLIVVILGALWVYVEFTSEDSEPCQPPYQQSACVEP